MKLLYITGDALRSSDQSWLDILKKAADAYADSVEVYAASYDDLLHICRDQKWTIFDLRNNLMLDDYSVVHFRNYSARLNEVGVIASYLDENGIKTVNPDAKHTYNPSSKLWQMKKFNQAGIPVPDTYYFHSSSASAGMSYINHNNYDIFPIVIKLIDGMKGSDNYLVKSEEELSDVFRKNDQKQFIIQPFIPNDGDFRLLFIGADSDPFIFRRVAAQGSHLNNTSKGGDASEVMIDEFDEQYISICRQAAKIMNVEISGVDLIINSKTQEPYILEVNVTPALLTGFDVSKKTDKYFEYILSTENKQ